MYIETERLILRPYTPADFEDYFAYIKDRELQADLGVEGLDDRDCAIINFQWLLEHRELLALERRDSGKVIGHICVHPPDRVVAETADFRRERGASLSFAIAKNERRKGLMSEVLAAVIDRLFREDGLDYLDCECTPENLASAALQAKMGFQFWGTEQLGDVELAVSIRRNGGT